eukprot:CAMPEP_0198315628 /NCGR_PEP_ID=MMETSP1450-20131203/5832_1 /TAXON_ID=753684 ORGANISM="Madagascaria erythrocladiodes, Strain CCMP3234" /NCGR_SAMPLE_ID=MMETSP1450 /ASSEMBLY_ACC=CAM_ASM_001115 /LENGTH=485 /DNA_ID=CAMNT_0044018749 /DNA_START=170 /DNA_END=1627 /DNA_ORIENTATION=+
MKRFAILLIALVGWAAANSVTTVPLSSLPWVYLIPRANGCPRVGRIEAPLLPLQVDENGQFESSPFVTCGFNDDDQKPYTSLKSKTFVECYDVALSNKYAAFEFTQGTGDMAETRCDLYEARPSYVTPSSPDLNTRCYVKDFPRFTLLTPESRNLGSGYCRTNEGSRPTGDFGEPIFNGSLVECEAMALRGTDVVGFEYDENLSRCELHETMPNFVESADGVWCFSKKLFAESDGISVPHIPYRVFKPDLLEECNDILLRTTPGSFNPGLDGFISSGGVGPSEVRDFYSNSASRVNGEDIRQYPFAPCEGNDFCFETDADLLKFDCVCEDLLPTLGDCSGLSEEEAIERYFDTSAYKECFERYIRLSSELFSLDFSNIPVLLNYIVDGKAYIPGGQLFNWRTLLDEACQTLRDTTTGNVPAFDVNKCIEITARVILLRDLESLMACYSATLQCSRKEGSQGFISVSEVTCDGKDSVPRPRPPNRR